MNNQGWLAETELVGDHVTLVPLQKAHAASLIEAASDGSLWELWFTFVPSRETVDTYIDTALADKAAGTSLPFAVVDRASNRIIGSTRFCHAVPAHNRVEIGYTWYAKRYQRTPVNAECKYLLLSHAFEQLSAIAVEFRTHWHNQASRQAISRLGAKQDGVLRNHQREPDGSLRDTVVFSILNSEWPAVKKSLEFRLSRPRT